MDECSNESCSAPASDRPAKKQLSPNMQRASNAIVAHETGETQNFLYKSWFSPISCSTTALVAAAPVKSDKIFEAKSRIFLHLKA